MRKLVDVLFLASMLALIWIFVFVPSMQTSPPADAAEMARVPTVDWSSATETLPPAPPDVLWEPCNGSPLLEPALLPANDNARLLRRKLRNGVRLPPVENVRPKRRLRKHKQRISRQETYSLCGKSAAGIPSNHQQTFMT